mmetsp:Transcript_117735/g.344886  ORF Transcript_117735/g.344886 Transcript_117735/m.344886 type:complete len:226 (+) Transcript_117735:149-826(+)
MVSAVLTAGMCMSLISPPCSSFKSSPRSSAPSQFTSRDWKAPCSETAKSSWQAGSMAATNSDHSICPSSSKSEAWAARSAAADGTPRPRRKADSSRWSMRPSALASSSPKRRSRKPSREAGSCEAALTAMVRHQRRFSRSSSRDCTCSCVREMAAEPKSWENQGRARSCRALGRLRSSKQSASCTTSLAPRLACLMAFMAGPARWASKRPLMPMGSLSLGCGAKG